MVEPINRSIAKECLFLFDDVMRGRWPYFLTDGTLLGAVRDGDFIAYDTDIDVGIWADKFDPKMVDALVNAGFTLTGMRGTPNDGLVIKLSYKDLQFDIYGYHRGETFSIAIPHRSFRLRAHLRPFSLAPISFLDRPFLAPDPPEQYLEDGYGPTWRQPLKIWNFRYSPPNIRVEGGPMVRFRYRLKRWWRLRRLT